MGDSQQARMREELFRELEQLVNISGQWVVPQLREKN